MSSTSFDQPTLRHLWNNFGKLESNQNAALQQLTKPHIDSFNHFINEGLSASIQNIAPVVFALPDADGTRVELSLKDGVLLSPQVPAGCLNARTVRVYPAECRQRATTYKSKLQVKVDCKVGQQKPFTLELEIADIPIMVKSSLCNLAKLTPAQLVARGEESEEMGGYFIVNGKEKVFRMLIQPRRNYPLALTRGSWKQRGKQYSEYGVQMRCVKSDSTISAVTLHYLHSGAANVSFSWMKEWFFVPLILILKALVDVTDHYIYTQLVKGREDDSFFRGCIANMLREAQADGLMTRTQILNYIGEKFRVKVNLPAWTSNADVTQFLLNDRVCIHLDNNMDKFNTLIYMTRKLFAFAKGKCAAESPDNPMFHEVLTSGQFFQMVLKEKLQQWLVSVQFVIDKKVKAKPNTFKLDAGSLREATHHALDISRSIEYLLATGNLVSKTGLGLQQASGYAVVADKLNFYRYLSHFRCVHRGQFFSEQRVTSVRRLFPEAWGFICPVHTPDGTPCGLMNHLTKSCELVNTIYQTGHLPKLLCEMGMTPHDADNTTGAVDTFPVLLDGRLVGWLSSDLAVKVASGLRVLKVKGKRNVPRMMEICLVPSSSAPSQYPGLYLFTTPSRFMRPVRNIALNDIEYVGSFEQVYLHICITADEAVQGVTEHMEVSEGSLLSVVATMTPYSDFNQSPRNMYQCQMGKQTMGSPCQAYSHRADNKLYRIQTPQSPLVVPHAYDDYAIDNFPLGTNAVVAVISYTGYDMEDAMIINRASLDRGFAHGTIYKSEFVDLHQISGDRKGISLIFGCKPDDDACIKGHLDKDGLPAVGAVIAEGQPLYSYINVQTGKSTVVHFHGPETGIVDQVKILGNDLGTEELQKVCIVLRIDRNPIIGDKFSSRHGQKGIFSFRWPCEDMPFSESGMTPDIIFNPHGFPSRMTIGMMVECMAGKSGACHGLKHDATPFTFSETDPAADHFGKLLIAAGYNYYGNERLYSGINGCELEADIFFGVIYYQRLRHMVADKFQVRTTGPVDIITHQPVKGRKRGGGIRFGEMERDALIAHGTSFLLQDRLFHCSDESLDHVCTQCGSLLSPCLSQSTSSVAAVSYETKPTWHCLTCKRADTVAAVSIPHVFRYLVAELAAMNVKVKLDVRDH